MGTALAFSGQVSAAEGATEKPNVMFIFADDQTYESIGAYGQLNIKTPNLDRLVKRGVSFTHTYNMGAWAGAVCVASRAMLNSMMPAGLMHNFSVKEFASLLDYIVGLSSGNN